MSLAEAIRKANALLPGTPAPGDEEDPRWQAMLKISNYIESHPEEVWQFVAAWGGHLQEDLRDAVACTLLEHLLEYHFDLIFPRVEKLAATHPLFADTFCRCYKFGQSQIPTNAAKFDALRGKYRGPTRPHSR